MKEIKYKKLNVLYTSINWVKINEKENNVEYIIEVIIYLLKNIKFIQANGKVYVVTNKYYNSYGAGNDFDILNYIKLDISTIILNNELIPKSPYAIFDDELIYKFIFIYSIQIIIVL